MKDITITTKRQLTEIKIWIACFVFTFLLNLASIIIYKTEFKELYTQLLWVFILSIAIYGLLLVLRLLFALIKKTFFKKKG